MDDGPGFVDEIARKIVERFHPRRIVLFGSRATGRAGEGSDVDLMVEMDTPLRPAERALQISSSFGLRRWPMDVVVFTPSEAKVLRADPTSFVSQIEAEGRVLYER